MDPAGIGALIGFGTIACLLGTTVLYEKGTSLKEFLQTRWKASRRIDQPQLPIYGSTPRVMRSGSTQWKVKQLLDSK